MSEITQEMLEKETNVKYKKSISALSELYDTKEFTDIINKHNITMLDLSAAIVAQIFSASELSLKQDASVFEAINDFVDVIVDKTKLHPTDACLLLYKILSDMLMQIGVLANLQEQNKKEVGRD